MMLPLISQVCARGLVHAVLRARGCGARGLVYPLFAAQTTWFGMLEVCSVKGE